MWVLYIIIIIIIIIITIIISGSSRNMDHHSVPYFREKRRDKWHKFRRLMNSWLLTLRWIRKKLTSDMWMCWRPIARIFTLA